MNFATIGLLFHRHIPHSVRFVISANLGSGVFYVLNEALVPLMSSSLPDYYQPITAAWISSYLISIFIQYLLHAILVYGWASSFWSGVLSTYAGYSAALLASIPINMTLVNTLGFNASLAWFGTLAITGVANFFVLNSLLGKRNDPGTLKRSQSNANTTSIDII